MLCHFNLRVMFMSRYLYRVIYVALFMSRYVGLSLLFSVAWFAWDPALSSANVTFANKNTTVTGNGVDVSVVLGNLGFSKGVHYWEVTIDRLEGNPDPSFGVARLHSRKDIMLGE